MRALLPPPLLSAEIKTDLNLDDRCLLTDAFFAGIPCRVVGVNASKGKCVDAGVEDFEGDYVSHSRDKMDLAIASEVYYSVGSSDVRKPNHVVIASPVELNNLFPIEPYTTCWVIGAGGYNTLNCTLSGETFESFDSMISHLHSMYSGAGGKVVVVSSIASGFVIPDGGGNLTKPPASLIQNEKVREWYKHTITPVSSSFFMWVLDVCRSVVMEKEIKSGGTPPSEVVRVLWAGQEIVDAGFKKMIEKDVSKMGFSEELLSDIAYLKTTVSVGAAVGSRTGKWVEYFHYCEDPSAEMTDMVSFALMRSRHLAELVPYTTVQQGMFPAAVDPSSDQNTAVLVAKYGYLVRLRPGAFSDFVEVLNQFVIEWYAHSHKNSEAGSLKRKQEM
jgi:hypothetical protein